MNPFIKLTKQPLPPDARGERGYRTAAEAKASAAARGVTSCAILRVGQEYAWVAPLEAYLARSIAASLAGIHVEELCSAK